MGTPSLTRFAGTLGRRLFQRRDFLILAAPASALFRPQAPLGSTLLRVNARNSEACGAQAEKAMVDAGEPSGLAAPRLARGDEFFGWLMGSCIVCFGWVTRRQRTIARHRLADAPGRVFLYNFHTTMAVRGHGLYTALLLAIRHVLGNEGTTEFIVDAEKRNQASINAIGHAGFTLVAHAGFALLFNHWRWPHWRSVVDATYRDLFWK